MYDFLNPYIYLTDSYKVGHWNQYPDKTTRVSSYMESRGCDIGYDETVAFGPQALIKEHFLRPLTKGDVNDARDLFKLHFGKDLLNQKGWNYLVDKYGGYAPVTIKAVPEGTVMPLKNALMTVDNSDPNLAWVTNYIEGLLVESWYPLTVSSIARYSKKNILKALIKSGTPEDIPFKLHDFGFRGSTSAVSAALGGAGHLVNFMGTDNIPALLLAKHLYSCDMAGFSIPASEHSTITSWLKSGECDAFKNMLDKNPDGLVACVSDSYNIYKACAEYWGGALRDQIMNRKGTLVIRPDSGDPAGVLLKILDILWDRFGGRVNDKGYRVLDNHVRIIQGDGINPKSIVTIMDTLMHNKWSIDNLAFGSGGGLLQQMDRDTFKFAFKAIETMVDGESRDVFKQPITAPWKNSKKGRLKLVKENGVFRTVAESAPGTDELIPIYKDGELLIDQTFDDIRARAAEGLPIAA